jgi:hypothetical protein
MLGQVLCHLSYSTNPFWCWIFLRWDLGNFRQGWLQTGILLISASWVARITGAGHWHLADPSLYTFCKSSSSCDCG